MGVLSRASGTLRRAGSATSPDRVVLTIISIEWGGRDSAALSARPPAGCRPEGETIRSLAPQAVGLGTQVSLDFHAANSTLADELNPGSAGSCPPGSSRNLFDGFPKACATRLDCKCDETGQFH